MNEVDIFRVETGRRQANAVTPDLIRGPAPAFPAGADGPVPFRTAAAGASGPGWTPDQVRGDGSGQAEAVSRRTGSTTPGKSGSFARRIRAAALAALLCLGAVAGGPADAAGAREYRSEKHAFRLVPVGGPFDQAWGMAFLPDGRMLVTELDGNLRLLEIGGKPSEPLPGLPRIESYGQGGLMDVVLHPDFPANRRLYLSHILDTAKGRTTAVSAAVLEGDRLRGFETLFVGRAAGRGGRHFGSRLRFGPDGKLYVTIGDRGHRPNAQDLGSHAGAVLRLDPDGAAPPDNPFAGRAGALPEIWSYGHRNPQGLAFDPQTGRLWSQEHGPRGGDEVNLVRRGRNYGWPVITHGRNYSGTKITDETARPGMEQPATYWTPSIAPSGLTVYRGGRFPRWDGNLFAGALRAQLLVRLELDGDRVVHEERLLTDFGNRIRDVRTGPDGLIYLLLDENDADIWRLEPL